MSQPTDQQTNKDNERKPDTELPTPKEGRNSPRNPEIENIPNTDFPEKEKNFEGEKRNDDYNDVKGETPTVTLHEDGEIKEHVVSEKALEGEKAGEAKDGKEHVVPTKMPVSHKTSYDVVGKSIKNPGENPITPDN